MAGNVLHIGIWHLSETPFNGALVRSRPAGGTETAVAYTSESLAELGCSVKVFCNTPAPACIEGVTYVPVREFRRSVPDEQFDAFIIVRHLAVLTVPIQSRCLLYWGHDNMEQPFPHGMFRFFISSERDRELVCCFHLGELMHLIDGILSVSYWQAEAISKTFGISRSNITVIGNGLQPRLFESPPNLEFREPVIVYTLHPDRGLAHLLDIYDRVRRRMGGTELHLYSRSTIYGTSVEDDERVYGDLYALARTIPGVRHFDPVNQHALARAMSRAMVYAYPTTTEETFCISLLEAQAAGLVPIASTCGAIPERITDGKTGFLIHGDPSAAPCQMDFADRLVGIMENRELRISIAKEASRKALSREYSYQTVAGRLLSTIKQRISGREIRTVCFDVSKVPAPYPARLLGHGDPQHRPVTHQQLRGLKERFSELLRLY